MLTNAKVVQKIFCFSYNVVVLATELTGEIWKHDETAEENTYLM